MDINPNFSQQELLLIKTAGFEHLLMAKWLTPMAIYRIMCVDALSKETDQQVVDSLKRCMQAISNGKIKRMTKEFDYLIDL